MWNEANKAFMVLTDKSASRAEDSSDVEGGSENKDQVAHSCRFLSRKTQHIFSYFESFIFLLRKFDIHEQTSIRGRLVERDAP